jgi:transcriptional regulator with XRE-family HTH domain
MCISERLKQVLDAKNMTVTEFSNVTGISYRSAMNYLNEGRDPNVDALVKIHKGLRISITWLLTGNGTMFQAATQESTISPQEEKLIAGYRTLPKNLKDTFSILFDEFEKCR